MTEAFLRIDSLGHSFGELEVLRDISFEAEPGEIVALLGPSGSGKTTLLRSIAGFESPQRGTIEVEGREVTKLPPAQRGFGMVFQSYALFPHLDVGANVRFGLEAQGAAPETIASRVAEVLELVEMKGFEARKVSEISGGQQQRVALARALAPSPSLLMLDEPLSNLDPALRERTRRELREALKAIGITTLLVTHEQEEAFDLGDRVALLHEGRLEQIGSARQLYQEPTSLFVAEFVGRSSRLAGSVCEGGVEVRCAEQRVVWDCWSPEALDRGATVAVVVRPEALELGDRGEHVLRGRIVGERYLGAA
ncbi:MAG: ABC transporter ATP-binding protein, partial [Acidobacteriota bacterium]